MQEVQTGYRRAPTAESVHFFQEHCAAVMIQKLLGGGGGGGLYDPDAPLCHKIHHYNIICQAGKLKATSCSMSQNSTVPIQRSFLHN